MADDLDSSNQGALSKYRILEFAANYTVPYGGMLLGDQGAEVIKVETMTGDQMRYASSSRGGVSSIFINGNRNKRSLCLNMKDPAAVEIFKRLASTCDAVIQNFRPGVVERLGVGYEELKKLREDIVMVSVSGFGTEGPYARRKAYDTVIQGLSGVPAIQRSDTDGSPNLVKSMIVDKVTAMNVCQAVTSALLSREHTGKGQHIRISMLDCMVSFMWPDMMLNDTFVGEGASKAQSINDIRLMYKTKDDYIVVVFVSDDEWSDLVRAIGRPELAKDERFATIRARAGHYPEIYQELKDAFLGRATAEWVELLTEADAIAAPINTPQNLIQDPHIAATRIIWEGEHPVWGTYRQPRPAIQFDGTPSSIRRHAPLLGEHSLSILAELGWSTEEIEEYRAKGVIN